MNENINLFVVNTSGNTFSFFGQKQYMELLLLN